MTKRMRILIGMIYAAIPQYAQGVPLEVFVEHRIGSHLERIVGIPKSRLAAPILRELASAFVNETGPRYRTANLWIVTSRFDGELVQGVRATDQLYGDWRQAWIRQNKNPFPVGRVTVIAGNGRLQARVRGQIVSEPLSNDDPLSIEADGIQVQIAYLFARLAREQNSDALTNEIEYEVRFVSNRSATAVLTDSFMRSLAARLGTNAVRASVRLNTWFRDSNAPIVYPFSRSAVPPVKIRDSSSFESWCIPISGRFECHASTN